MSIDKNNISSMLRKAAQYLIENKDYLSEIDSKFGDGDHGITINKIANEILQSVDDWNDQSIKDFFDDLGMAIMEVKGGSAGPLYGTMIGGLGANLNEDENIIEDEGVKRMFLGCLEEMQDITNAKVGDKTMMDALIPAAEAIKNSNGDIKNILECGAKAAEEGAKNTENFVSKYGRARSYKEQTIGTPDAGAVSTSIFIRGLADGI